MARRKNLLEAFQAKPDPSGPAPAGGLPFDRPPRRAGGFGQPPRWLFVTVGLLVAFALGFALGRRTPGEAKAAGDARPPAPSAAPANQPRAFQERSPPAPAAAPAEDATGKRIEDSALYDTRNAWTIVVATYFKSNQASEVYAWASHDRLRDHGLPVFPPVVSKNLIVVLVDAAPSSAELAKTLSKVKALEIDGKADYVTAYCARIDTFIPDRKKGQ